MRYLNEHHCALNNKYGAPDQLQEEQHQITAAAIRALHHLPECVAGKDLSGSDAILDMVCKLCDALEILIKEDYTTREKAMTSFPLYDRSQWMANGGYEKHEK